MKTWVAKEQSLTFLVRHGNALKDDKALSVAPTSAHLCSIGSWPAHAGGQEQPGGGHLLQEHAKRSRTTSKSKQSSTKKQLPKQASTQAHNTQANEAKKQARLQKHTRTARADNKKPRLGQAWFFPSFAHCPCSVVSAPSPPVPAQGGPTPPA